MIPGIVAQGVRAGGGGGDPHFANVRALLHFDGVNGSTNIIDVKGHTFTANGTAALSEAQARFGASSLGFPSSGTPYVIGSSNADFGLGTNDYTIEFWFMFNDATGTEVLFDMRPLGSAGAGPMLVHAGSNFQWYINGGYRVVAGGPRQAGVWKHIAMTRASTVSRLFLDGVQIGADYTDTNDYGASQNIIFGRFSNGTSYLNGYIDEFRHTVGVCRYTANFTPPDAPFPNS